MDGKHPMPDLNMLLKDQWYRGKRHAFEKTLCCAMLCHLRAAKNPYYKHRASEGAFRGIVERCGALSGMDHCVAATHQ